MDEFRTSQFCFNDLAKIVNKNPKEVFEKEGFKKYSDFEEALMEKKLEKLTTYDKKRKKLLKQQKNVYKYLRKNVTFDNLRIIGARDEVLKEF